MLSLGPKCAWSGQFVAQLRKSLVVECCPKAFHHLLHRHSDSRHIGCTDSHKMLMHLIWQAWEMRSPEPHSFPWGPHSRPVHGPSWTNKTKPANSYAGLWQNREETIQQSSPAKCHGMEESGWYCCTGGWEIQEAQGRHQIGGNWLHTTLKASKDRWGFACRETEAWDREHQSQAICFRLSLTVQWVARLLEQRDIFARSQGLGHRLLGQWGQEKKQTRHSAEASWQIAGELAGGCKIRGCFACCEEQRFLTSQGWSQCLFAGFHSRQCLFSPEVILQRVVSICDLCSQH